ncbi:MAG: FtsX-like permease family protein [Hydrogenophilales bacterium]|nr:FtsX-like permease family protein [Hydrogenophilales bacterium]
MRVALPLAARLLLREWRAGEIRVLLLAVALAVASLTAVAFFADRVERALGQEANTLLAADLALVSDHPVGTALEAEARRRGLAVAHTTTFLSMALAGDGNLLAGIKAVSPGYPLRGALRTAPALFAADAPARGLPAPGQAWVDERLATGLGVRIGDPVEVGEARFTVAAILTFEGERGGNFMALAPRLLLNQADLPGTGLVQAGSRITYRLLVAGEGEAVAGFQAWAKERLERGQQLEDVRGARPELRQILDRAQRYLGLAAVLTVVLAAAAAHMALRRYTRRHFDQFALLRCFGASRRRLLGLYFQQLASLGLLAGLLGGFLGWLAQRFVVFLLGDALRLGLPPASPRPLLLAVVAGCALVLAFSLPPLLRLARVPALRVLRRDLGPPGGGSLLAHGAGLALVGGLLFWQAGDGRLGLWVIAGVLATTLAAVLVVQGLLRPLPFLARRLPASRHPLVLGPRLALTGLRRRGWETTLQAIALSLGLFALLLLTLVRDDLLESWRSQVPAGAPNRFVINIQPDQVAAVRAFLTDQGVRDVVLYPMARARLVAIAGRPVSPDDYEEDRARRLAEREFNLSAMAEPPPDNRIVAGRWWARGETQGFSVEAGIADTLGIRLGDVLDFDAGGLPLSGRVTSLRQVDWDSFRVNFFVVAPAGVLDALPRSHITSFYLPPARVGVLSGLVAAFPNVTVIDVEQVMAELRGLMDRVSGAVRTIFLFSLGTGLLVMLAALYARRDERAREIGIWRTLGASRATLRAALAAEFAVLGLLAGAVAAGAASLLAWVLATRVFDLPHAPDPWIWLAGLGGGLLLVLATGLAATRGLLNQPPLAAIRAGA